jgi:hypothetical protein
MAEAAASGVAIIKYGIEVFNFLRELFDNTIMMKCVLDENAKTFIFTAYEHRALAVRLISAPQWRDSVPNHFSPRERTPKSFKVIKVVCENDTEWRSFFNKYHGQSGIEQKNLIDHLKIIAQRYAHINI